MIYLFEEFTQLQCLQPDISDFIRTRNSEGYWIWNIENFTDRWYSEGFWNNLGYYNKEEFEQPHFWQSVIIEEDLDYCNDNISKFLLNPECEFDQLLRYRHANGDIVWIHCKGKVVYNELGEPYRMLGITSQKGYIHFQQDYQNLLEHTNKVARIGHWEVNLKTQKIYWSKITREIHEVNSAFNVTIASAMAFYDNEETGELLVQSFRNAITNGVQYDKELLITTAQGNQRWVRAIGIPEMENGTCKRIYGLVQDIDTEVRNIRLLGHQEELFRNTFENASIGMALVSLTGEWLRVNESLCKMLGYDKEQFYKLTFQDITHPADLSSDLDQVHALIDGKADSFMMEKRYFHKNGDIVWAILAVSIIRDKSGNPLHFVSQITDISSRKLATKKIESLLEITQNQNKRLLNFAHIVSHNLRSHTGNLSMLMDLITIEVPVFANNEYFEMVNQAVTNLSETINHLNQVILVHTKTRDDLKYINLSTFITKALNGLNGLILDHNAIINNMVDDTVEIKFVPAYLDSVLLNLISNALKYRDPKRRLTINLSTETANDYQTLTISDNGLGIDMETCGDRIFGMYKTFHNNPEARGIGLFITKNQIEAMDGKIEVASTVGQGTTFKVYFKK